MGLLKYKSMAEVKSQEGKYFERISKRTKIPQLFFWPFTLGEIYYLEISDGKKLKKRRIASESPTLCTPSLILDGVNFKELYFTKKELETKFTKWYESPNKEWEVKNLSIPRP